MFCKLNFIITIKFCNSKKLSKLATIITGSRGKGNELDVAIDFELLAKKVTNSFVCLGKSKSLSYLSN